MADKIIPIAIVCTALALLLGGAVFGFFRKPFTPSQWLLYYVNLLVARFVWRVRVSGQLSLPPDRGAVIIANHRSSIDPCIIQVVVGHRVCHWMVAQLYGQRSLIGWMMRTVEIIPVQRRGKDISPTKTAIRLAAAGELVGMLPEGTINTGEEFMRSVRPGAVLVALKARVSILPCYIEGAPYHDVAWKSAFMPARVRVKVGELVDLSEYHGREGEEGVITQLTVDCVREIAKLAGRDDFQPRLAGRDWKTWQ